MPKVSIIIRTKNKANSIGIVLGMIAVQSFKDFEVVVVDSGSTDSTLEIAREFSVRVLTIPSELFTYGYAMNVGCAAAQAEIFVGLSAHSIPRSRHWLENLLFPFSDPLICGTCSDGSSGYVKQNKDMYLQAPYIGLSNANSAYRKALWTKRPFDEKMFGTEDRDWQFHFQKEGYWIVNVLGAEVLRVDSMTRRERWIRSFNEIHGYAQFLDNHTLLQLLFLDLRKFLASPSRWEMCRFLGSLQGYLKGRRQRSKDGKISELSLWGAE